MEFASLQEILVKILGVDADEITLETTFEHDLGADSLDMYQVVMAMEETFSVTVKEEEVADIKVVGDAVALIKKYTQE